MPDYYACDSPGEGWERLLFRGDGVEEGIAKGLAFFRRAIHTIDTVIERCRINQTP